MRYSEQMCPRFQHAMEILGKRWTGLIVQLLIERPLRFGELAERLEVVSDRMLSERLKELELEGLVERRAFAEVPVRVEYSLTTKGQALGPVINSIESWSHDSIPETVEQLRWRLQALFCEPILEQQYLDPGYSGHANDVWRVRTATEEVVVRALRRDEAEGPFWDGCQTSSASIRVCSPISCR